MSDFSRRRFVSLAAMVPVAGGALAAGAVSAAFPEAGAADAPHTFAPAAESSARRRIQQMHLPNLPLITQDGQQVYFYDDLVKGKVVTLNFFYAKCDEVCPRVTANLAKVQKLLGDQVGRDLFMYSITLKPEEDSPQVLKHCTEMFDVKPGWTLLTGKPDDIEHLRKSLGFTYPDPAIDKDKTQHIGNIRYGNEPLMLWSACPGMAHAEWIAETVEWMVRPNTIRLQKP